MAAVVNARDVMLQSASVRVQNVSLPGNVTSIPSTVNVTGYGTLGGIAITAVQASSTASSAYGLASSASSAVANKLEKGASYVMSGSFALKTSNFESGTGLAVTSNGILMKKLDAIMMTLDNTGSAVYSGDVTTSGDGRFYGMNTSTETTVIAGSFRTVDYSVYGQASTNAASTANVRAGVFGYADATNCAYNAGILGYGGGTTRGIGVAGFGMYRGGYFNSGSAGIALVAEGSNQALLAVGPVSLSGNTTVSGWVNATGNVTAYGSSDIRLKQNIRSIQSPLDIVGKLNGVFFDWTDEYIESQGGEDGYFVRRHDVGVIAQEVQAVLPEIVAKKPDGTLGVRYEKLVAVLIEAVKELARR